MGKKLGTSVVRPRGEFTFPADVRKTLSIEPGDRLDIFFENGTIILKKVIHDYKDFTMNE